MTLEFSLPVPKRLSEQTFDGPLVEQPLLDENERRHRELLLALEQLAGAVEDIEVPDAAPAVVPAAPGMDPYLLADAVRAALAPLMESQRTLTTEALEAVVDRLKVLSRQVVAGASGGGFGSGVTVNNDESNPVPVTTVGGPELSLDTTESGSLFTESIRDDISITFSRDQGPAALAAATALVEEVTGNTGSVAHDATEGQVVFSTGAAAGRIAYYRSTKNAVYEPGHTIRGEQTVEVRTLPTGTQTIEWGYGEDDGSGNVLNGVGWGMDADGLYTWRRKAGVLVTQTRQADFLDPMDGTSGGFTLMGSPVAFQPDKNTLYRVDFEWLGAAPPQFRMMTPDGDFMVCNIEGTVNRITGTTVPEPQLPLFVRIYNGSGGDLSVRSGSWRGGINTSKTILMGQQPDGDYVSAKADGTVFTTTSTLGSSGTFTSDWFDSDGWRSIGLVVKSNVVSAGNGIVVEFTDDVGGAQTVRSSRMYTFGADDVTNGFLSVRFPVELDGFRVRYTNGGTAQGSFFLGCDVRTDITELARAGIETTLVSTSSANMTRGILSAKDPSSATYNNVTRTGVDGSSRSGLHVGIMECAVDLPIKALTTWSTGQASVASNTTPVVAISSPLSGRKTFVVKALSGNSQNVYIGPSASLTTGNGYPLAANEAVVIEVDTTAALYILGATSATQNVAFIQVG